MCVSNHNKIVCVSDHHNKKLSVSNHHHHQSVSVKLNIVKYIELDYSCK